MHELTSTLFQEPWWLDAVAPGSWDAIEVEQGGSVTARLPYVIERRRALTRISMPPLTQVLGPWLRPSEAKYAKRLGAEKDLLTELFDRLPPYDELELRFHHSVTNWLPLYWRGFEQTTRYTYVLDDIRDAGAIWSGAVDSVRRSIRKATGRSRLAVRSDGDIERFLDLHAQTFERQSLALPYPRAIVRRIDAAASARDARRIFFALDPSGQIAAALFLVWDERAAYYLMSGTDPAFRSSGALALLMFEAIRFAGTVSRSFDFEGSMIEPIERVFRGFGARQVPYFEVRHLRTRRARIVRGAQTLVRALRGKA